MSDRHEAAHLLSVVLLIGVSILFFAVVLFTSFLAWLTALPFAGQSQTDQPRAAAIVVGVVSVASQVLVMFLVGRSVAPLLFRALIILAGVAIVVVHGVVLYSLVTAWQRWGTSPKFWTGTTDGLWLSLMVSALAPVTFYGLVRTTRLTDRLRRSAS